MVTKREIIDYLIKQGHNPDEVKKIVDRNYSGFMAGFNKYGVTDTKRIARAVFLN